VVSYTSSRDQGTSYTNLNVFPNSPNWLGYKGYGHNGPDSADANTGFLDLTPGGTAHIHFDFFLDDDNGNTDTNENVSGEPYNSQDITDVPDEIGFYASALPESGSL
jgi:hypothetical protein